MKKNLLKSCLIAALLAVTSAGASAASKGWEPVKSEYHDAKSVAKEDEVEIKTASSLIIVTASHPVHIKVFTILGRLVSEETLQPPAHPSSQLEPMESTLLKWEKSHAKWHYDGL